MAKKQLQLEVIDLQETPIAKVERQLNAILEANPYAEIKVDVMPDGNHIFVQVYQKRSETATERQARELADTIVTELKQSLKSERPQKVIIPKERVQRLKDAIVGENSSIGKDQ